MTGAHKKLLQDVQEVVDINVIREIVLSPNDEEVANFS